MKNNLHYLTKWCHAMGYTIRIGLNNFTIRYKSKTIHGNIDNVNHMGYWDFEDYIELIKWSMEDK